MDNRITVCESIAADMTKDAADFDGKPFTGKTMGEYMGYHGAAIAALSNLVKSLLEEKKAEGKENNIDFAEMLMEVVGQVIKTQPISQPVTYDNLLTALQEYKKTEEHEILKLRKYKKENL